MTKKEIDNLIGREFTSNFSPTLRGILIKVDRKKLYFEIIENPEYDKYNYCSGDIEDLPISVLDRIKFDE